MHNTEKGGRKKRTPLHKDNLKKKKKGRLRQQKKKKKKNTFPDLNFLPPWSKWRIPWTLTKSSVGYSDMRERPVSLLSCHPNKHELEPAVSSTVVN